MIALSGPALRKGPRSRTLDKCGTVFRGTLPRRSRPQVPSRNSAANLSGRLGFPSSVGVLSRVVRFLSPKTRPIMELCRELGVRKPPKDKTVPWLVTLRQSGSFLTTGPISNHSQPLVTASALQTREPCSPCSLPAFSHRGTDQGGLPAIPSTGRQ